MFQPFIWLFILSINYFFTLDTMGGVAQTVTACTSFTRISKREHVKRIDQQTKCKKFLANVRTKPTEEK